MLLDKACHILFAADMYYPGPVIIDTGSEDGLRDYSEIMKTVLARVEELGITRIFGGHNRIEETPEWDSGDGSVCPRAEWAPLGQWGRFRLSQVFLYSIEVS